jgi:hypothetical protein
VDVEEETEEGTFVERVRCRRPAPIADPLLSLFPDVLADLPRVPLGRRTQPVVYPHAVTLRCETTVRELPEGVTLPAARDLSGDGWSVKTVFTREGGDLRGTWELTLARRRFAPDEFEELRSFWNAARLAASAAIRLRPRDAGS